MADSLSVEARSARMALIKGKDTAPELFVRRLVHKLGFRYRLHASDLPGKPDLVFRRLRKVIFVHGCFWHRHRKPTCTLARLPKSRQEFWISKLEGNRLRDIKNRRVLRSRGWAVFEVWECDVKNVEALSKRILYFLTDEVS